MQNKQLYQTKIFLVFITLPVVFSLVITYWICSNSSIPPISDSKSLNSLLTIFKIPLGILSLAIPLVAMSAALHRSEQTARQIETQQSQNNFVNHFKHLEEFKKSFESGIPLGWASAETFHKDIFPDTTQGSFKAFIPLKNPNETIIEFLNACDRSPLNILNTSSQSYYDLIKEFPSEKKRSRQVTPIDIIKLFNGIQKATRLSGFNDSPYQISEDLISQVEEFDQAAQTMIAFRANSSIIESKLQSKEHGDVTSKMGIHANEFYRPLAIGYVWHSMGEDYKNALFSNATMQTQDYLNNLDKLKTITFKEYQQSFDGLFVTDSTS